MPLYEFECVTCRNQILDSLKLIEKTPNLKTIKSVLKKYSQNKGVIDSKWNMVTGDKKQIYNLARKSYLVAEDIVGQRQYDMIHTENFVLVDSKRRIRGFYDGTDIDVMNNLISDIKICLLYTSPSPRDQRGSRMPASA